MKKLYGMLLIVFCIFCAITIGTNIYLKNRKVEEDNTYRVELNRVEKNIERYGKDDADRYDFITGIVSGRTAEELINTDSEYKIIKIGDLFYRIDYVKGIKVKDIRPFINLIILLCFIFVCGFIIIIGIHILKPFNKFSELPYELSKGNLVVPVKENKNRYFGRFLWGMDLLREKLEDDRKKELELVKEKKMVLLSLSHDIKTPLSAIKLYSKALSKNLYSDETKKQMIAVNIDSKVSEIEKFVADIVNASNEDFLEFDVNNSEIYVRDVLSYIDEYYSEKMELSQIDFTISEYKNSLICGDKERLIEVIQNIIENAIKYGDGGYIRIDCDKIDNEYHINISNSGCELKREELVHVFDSFFRGTNSGKQSGSGLGLYICRKLVHMMEGEIFADINDGVMYLSVILKIA